jgi:hypothetical protein
MKPETKDNIELSPRAQKLLNHLVADFKSRLKEEERVFDKSDGAGLIFNLFAHPDKYGEFSYKAFKELFNYITK